MLTDSPHQVTARLPLFILPHDAVDRASPCLVVDAGTVTIALTRSADVPLPVAAHAWFPAGCSGAWRVGGSDDGGGQTQLLILTSAILLRLPVQSHVKRSVSTLNI